MKNKKEKLESMISDIKDAVKNSFNYHTLFDIFDPDEPIYYTEYLIELMSDKEELLRAFLYGDGIEAYGAEFVKFNGCGNVVVAYIDDEIDSLVEEMLSDDFGLKKLLDYLRDNLDGREDMFDIYLMIDEYFELRNENDLCDDVDLDDEDGETIND